MKTGKQVCNESMLRESGARIIHLVAYNRSGLIIQTACFKPQAPKPADSRQKSDRAQQETAFFYLTSKEVHSQEEETKAQIELLKSTLSQQSDAKSDSIRFTSAFV